MMFSDLFKKENINCPEWLSCQTIEDYWLDSFYICENRIHKWIHEDEFRTVVIIFDGEILINGAYLGEGFVFTYKIITEHDGCVNYGASFSFNID